MVIKSPKDKIGVVLKGRTRNQEFRSSYIPDGC